MITTYKCRIYPTKRQQLDIINMIELIDKLSEWYYRVVREGRMGRKMGKKFVTRNLESFEKWSKIFLSRNPYMANQLPIGTIMRPLRRIEKYFRFLKKTAIPKNRSRVVAITMPGQYIRTSGNVLSTFQFGRIKHAQQERLPPQDTIISFDYMYRAGKFYIIIRHDVGEKKSPEKSRKYGIGIDLGERKFAEYYNQEFRGFNFIHNFNNEHRMRRLERRRNRLEDLIRDRVIENRIHFPKSDYRYYVSKTVGRLMLKLERVLVRMENIRVDRVRNFIANITKNDNYFIAIETIDVEKNIDSRILDRGESDKVSVDNLRNCKWGYFKRHLIHVCRRKGIELRLLKWGVKTSKTCSKCGQVDTLHIDNVKRIVRCTQKGCGMKMDRDMNAAINIANATKKQYVRIV